MPTANGYTVGDDVSLVVQTSAGQLVLPVTEFRATPKYEDIMTRPIGQKPVHDVIPNGWDLSFKVDRTDSTIDDYFAAYEAAYFAGTPFRPGYVQQTIREKNGAISQYKFTKVSLKLTDAGTYAGPKRVEQSMAAMASDRVKVQ